MNEIERLETDIEDLKNAYDDVLSAINNISEIEGLDEEYTELDRIAQAIDEKRTDLEIEYSRLEEEAFYQENEEQWKAEQREQEYDYENSKI